MSKKNVNSLHEEFTDLSQSVIGDVLKTYNNDTSAAAKALRGIENQEKTENERKINELQEMFPDLSRDGIIRALKENGWNVEESIAPLFIIGEEERKARENASKRTREENERKRQELEAKKAAENLMEVFYTLPKELIQNVLDENEGDIEDTTNQLLSIVAKREEENASKKEEEQCGNQQNLKELKIQSLEKKFEDLSEGEVIGALNQHNWDIKKAHNQLLQISTKNKSDYLKSLFQWASMEEIRNALESHDWNQEKAAQVLIDMSKEKRTSPAIVKKVETSIFDRADEIGQQLEEEITASHIETTKYRKEEAKRKFRDNLEQIIETQVRNGPSPGIAPPTLKEIDDRLGKPPKARPIADEELKSSEAKEKQNPVQVMFSDTKAPPALPSIPKFAVTLHTPTDVVDVGDTITVEWVCTQGETTNYDWIGLFRKGEPNKQYVTYQWRGRSDTTKGSLSFVAPKVYGEYEFRYFYYGSYEHTTRSNSVSVGPRFELSAALSDSKDKVVATWKQLSGHPYSRTWIGLYAKDQDNNKSYITWEYATGSEVIFAAPIKPQEYEFRIFTNSYVHHSRSNSFKIEGEDHLSAALQNGVITVSVHIVTVDPSLDNAWVGVYFTSEKDHHRFRRYKYLYQQRTGNLQFKAPSHGGEYEVRLFAHNSYEPILVSNPFHNPGTQ